MSAPYTVVMTREGRRLEVGVYSRRELQRTRVAAAHGGWAIERVTGLAAGDLGQPTSVRELVEHLEVEPRVLCRAPGKPVVAERYLRHEAGGLWFGDDDGGEHYIPLNCGRVPAESGLAFRPDGFAVTKFGVTIEYLYVRPIVPVAHSPLTTHHSPVSTEGS
jgi:hypothetical protein